MNTELAKLKELQPGIWGMMAGSTNPRTGKMVLAETEMLHMLEFVNLVPDAVEAAEARIAEYGMSPGHAHQRQCESRAARNELGFGEDADDVAPADLREAIQELRKRAEAAEAQVKELTADLDKESEIRHRIHEELNAIKGEQQPIGYIDSASLREYRGVKAGGSWSALPKTGEYNQTTPIYTHPAPAVLPPVVDSWHNSASHIMSSLQFNGDETSFTVGANWMRQQVLDMGAKPLPVIEFDGADMDSARGITGEGDEYCRGFIDGLLDGADQVRAAGLEVKS